MNLGAVSVVLGLLSEISSAATAAGAFLIAIQLWLARNQLRSQFEQGFARRYEEVISRIPLARLLKDPQGDSPRPQGNSSPNEGRLSPEAERAFYDYFEVCEDELYYRGRRRISKPIWIDWWSGMRLNLQRPTFEEVWNHLKGRAVIIPSAPGSDPLWQFEMLRLAMNEISKDEFDPWSRHFKHRLRDARNSADMPMEP